MQATSVETTSAATVSRERRGPADGEAFAGILLGVQSAGLVAAGAVPIDATGLQPEGADEPASARRERINQETQAARNMEAQERRGGAHQADEARGGLDQTRTVEARKATVAEHAQRGAEQSALPGRGNASAEKDSPVPARTAPLEADQADQPQGDAASRLGKAHKESLGKTEHDQGKAVAEPEPEIAPATGKTVSVATAGAASMRLAEGRSAPVSPAEAVGRALGGRGDGGSQPAPAAGPAGGGDTGTRTSARTAAGPERPAGAGGKTSPQGAEAARRPEFQQLLRALRGTLAGRESSATLRLDPPELGRMKVDLRMVDDALAVRVEVTSSRARELLNGRLEQLSAALREHDVRMERFEVIAVEEQERSGQQGGGASMNSRDASSGADEDSAPAARRAPVDASGEVAAEAVNLEKTISATQVDVRA